MAPGEIKDIGYEISGGTLGGGKPAQGIQAKGMNECIIQGRKKSGVEN